MFKNNDASPLILVVEDVHEIRDGMEKLLTTDGYRVSLARDEQEALENARVKSPDLILVSLGGWIRGTQVVSGSVMADYNEASAKVLRQPALVSFIQTKVGDISPELQKEPLVKAVSEQLTDIQKLVTFASGATPTAEEVGKLNGAVSKLMEEIQNKSDAK